MKNTEMLNNQFTDTMDYMKFMRRYKTLTTTESPWKENLKRPRIKSNNTDMNILTNRESIDKLFQKCQRSLDTYFYKKTLNKLLTYEQVEPMRISINMIMKYYNQDPDITLYGVTKELMRYSNIRTLYKPIEVYRFVYTYFSQFPDGYYIRGKAGTVNKIYPLNNIR